MGDEPATSEITSGPGLRYNFYVGPRIEGRPESDRARAVVHTTDTPVGLVMPATELDRMSLEWLNARGLFNLDAFTEALAAERAELDAADAAEMSTDFPGTPRGRGDTVTRDPDWVPGFGPVPGSGMDPDPFRPMDDTVDQGDPE